MKTSSRLLALLFASALSVIAQNTPSAVSAPTLPPAAPATAPRPPLLVSPEVTADRSVTFRFKSANAKAVTLRGQWAKDPLALTRSDDGLWSVATTVAPGVWEYSFTMDGISIIDPANPAIKPMREPRTSILHIPDASPAPWDFQDVPHGTVHQHTYLSKALGRPREVWIYTPPGYEKSASTNYPLLVLQHGSGDNQQTWVAHGHAHWILDSLIAAGKARPMVVVMLDGHPFTPTGMRDGAGRGSAPMDAFRRELFEDAIPLVEATYRVEADVSQRGIVGLSMGGGQSLTVGLGHLNRFAWIGSFSGVPPEEAVAQTVLADAANTNAKLRLLWIGCGADDFLLKRNEEFVGKLKAAGVNHEWHRTAGNHSWPVWRGYLADFLPRVFQPASVAASPK